MYYYDKRVDFSDMLGKTLVSIERIDGDNGDELIFKTLDGGTYRAFHEQDCCETVRVNDIDGSFDDLIGSPLLQCEEVTNSEDTFGWLSYEPESFTWTFYKMATINGYVTIRWLGESNGYYSEGVSLYKD
jgi:hypothetical protein